MGWVDAVAPAEPTNTASPNAIDAAVGSRRASSPGPTWSPRCRLMGRVEVDAAQSTRRTRGVTEPEHAAVGRHEPVAVAGARAPHARRSDG